MARVVKKEKKQKQEIKNKKPIILISSIVGGLAAVGLIVLLVFLFMSNQTPRLYKNARDINYEELVEMQSDASYRERYEGVIYVLVFNSDIEEYPNYEITGTSDGNVKSIISSANTIRKQDESEKKQMSSRTAFYVLDLMDKDNEGILENTTFGSKSDKPYILEITNKSSGLTVKSKTATTAELRDLATDFKGLIK